MLTGPEVGEGQYSQGAFRAALEVPRSGGFRPLAFDLLLVKATTRRKCRE